MSIFPKEIFTALQSVFSVITYVDTVTVRKYRRINPPDFNYYCIIINPISATAEKYDAGGQRRVRYEIELVLLGKMFNGEEDAVMADSPTASPPNVGILAMYEDVFTLLYKNDLGGKIELYPGLIELDTRTAFNVITMEDREEFLVEMVIPYRPSGYRFLSVP